MICDVCNAAVDPNEEKAITAEVFRDLMNHGFGIHETNIEMLTSSEMSRDEAIQSLRQTYSTYTSDWLLCPKCVLEATEIMEKERPRYIDITENAHEYPGYSKLGCRICLSNDVWDKCVKWEEADEEKQGYQQQDTRLHDVLFVLSFQVHSGLNNETIKNGWEYKLACVIRDGISQDAVNIHLKAIPKEIEGEWVLVIEYQGYSEIGEEY
jgi:hypothetical protein